jgi:hypothetical protein
MKLWSCRIDISMHFSIVVDCQGLEMSWGQEIEVHDLVRIKTSFSDLMQRRHVSISGATSLSTSDLHSDITNTAFKTCPPLSNPPSLNVVDVAEVKASAARRLKPQKQPSIPDMSGIVKSVKEDAVDEGKGT